MGNGGTPLKDRGGGNKGRSWGENERNEGKMVGERRMRVG